VVEGTGGRRGAERAIGPRAKIIGTAAGIRRIGGTNGIAGRGTALVGDRASGNAITEGIIRETDKFGRKFGVQLDHSGGANVVTGGDHLGSEGPDAERNVYYLTGIIDAGLGITVAGG
jgi:hypothetical protein